MKRAPKKSRSTVAIPQSPQTPMHREELVHRLATKADLSLKQASQVLDAFQETIIDALKDGHSVRLMGFGTFVARPVAGRTIKAIRSQEPIHIPPSLRVGFMVGSVLRRACQS